MCFATLYLPIILLIFIVTTAEVTNEKYRCRLPTVIHVNQSTSENGDVLYINGRVPLFFHEIYFKFLFASCISNSSSTIVCAIYQKVHLNKLTMKIDRFLIQYSTYFSENKFFVHNTALNNSVYLLPNTTRKSMLRMTLSLFGPTGVQL